MSTANSGFQVFLHRLSAMELDSTLYLPSLKKNPLDPLSITAKIPDLHYRDNYCRPFWISPGEHRGLLSGKLKVRLQAPGKSIEAYATVASGIEGVWIDQKIWPKRVDQRNQTPSLKPRIDIGMFMIEASPEIIGGCQTIPEITHGVTMPTAYRIFNAPSNLDDHQILVSSSLLKTVFDFSMEVICGLAPLRTKFIKSVVPWSTSDEYSTK